jgi:(E)-4-hydroxy-3-methylbut-2-enyl-diphosphate synthase
MFSGAIRSAAGIGILLEEGIGDTIRVSLSADPVKEILAGRVILECLGLKKEGIRVISCPTCARANADVSQIASTLEDSLSGIKRHLTVAVMGCVVNGPGEARDADIGVACDTKGAMLFMHGRPVKRINSNEIIKTITDEIEKECNE